MKKILVTGGAGFIGSHVVERLLKSGHEVAVIDDLNDFYSVELKRANLAEVARAGSLRLYEIDICDAERVACAFAEIHPDTVIHLAARAGVRPSLEQPLLYARVNVNGTMVLLEACRRYNVRKFVFASSSSIYGMANKVPFREDDTAALPISPYAATKIAGEKFCYTYSHLYGIQAVCLRFFTVYGPRQRPDLAIRKFTEMIDCGFPIPVFGDGSSARDYTYIEDIVHGVIAASELETTYDVFNLGNADPVSLSELIRTLENALGKEAKIQRLPIQAGDVPITYADVSKARRILKYVPETPLQQGIDQFVRWYRSQDKYVAAHHS
jgi:UDP-glucuronate 4-epimerase